MVGLLENLVTRRVVARSFVEDSRATLGPSAGGLVEKFRLGLHNSVRQVFRARSIDSQFRAHTAIECINLRFSGGAAS